MEDAAVIIVGAGPSGLATSACLKLHSIPHIILERSDCFAPLWNKYSYDCVRLQHKKHLGALPHFPYPSSYPHYPSKNLFLQYLNDYISKFDIRPTYGRCVESADYDGATKKWKVTAKNVSSGEIEEYSARCLVVATGLYGDPHKPEVEGLSSFTGEVIHSTQYKNGKCYANKKVLVVGSGSSGMEIAVDLANHGAKTSIVVRSPVHIIPLEITNWAMTVLRYGVPMGLLDWIIVTTSKIMYGDTAKYGIARPKEGIFEGLQRHKFPVFHEVGTYPKIKSGEIQVLPAIESIRGNEVVFVKGESHPFDAIVFCTGFKRSTEKWLKAEDHDYLMDDQGLAKPPTSAIDDSRGLYCIGMTGFGLYGIAPTAQNLADRINSLLHTIRTRVNLNTVSV